MVDAATPILVGKLFTGPAITKEIGITSLATMTHPISFVIKMLRVLFRTLYDPA